MFTKSLLSLTLVLWAITLVGCTSPAEPAAPATPNPVDTVVVEEMPEPMPGDETIVEMVVQTEDVSTLRDIVVALDLVETLSSEGPFTVFAPTNEAFATLLADLNLTLEELLADEETLRSIVTYHVLEGAVPASAVLAMENEATAATLNGESITIFNEDGVQVDTSNVITTDILASNWVIHLIDTVLVPESLRGALGREDTATPLTGTIVTTAVDSGSFPTLVAAVQAAWLVDTLNGEWPFTLFAPTEEAFADLLATLEITAEDLLADTDLLTTVLTYHVLPWTYSAEAVLGLDGATAFETVQGTEVTVNPNDWQPTINDVSIVQTDIVASNGVIHVIDAVLVPAS